MEQYEPPSRFQHPERLTIRAGLVGDVHHHVVRMSPIEARIGKRQSKRAAFHDSHPIAHAGRDVQFPCGVTVLRRQIHAGDGATMRLRDPSRRTTDAAADIQDRFPRPRFEPRDEILSRQHTATMDMIEWCQRFRRDRNISTGGRAQRLDDTGGDAASRAGPGVMILDALTGHRPSPSNAGDSEGLRCGRSMRIRLAVSTTSANRSPVRMSPLGGKRPFARSRLRPHEPMRIG
jgi:hypothetical protein